MASYAAFERAVAYCRAGQGPAFVHAHVIRPYSHSLSDDEQLYRPDAERQRDAQRDPITRMQMFLMREGILDEKGINQLEKQVDDDLQVAATVRCRRLRRRPTRYCSISIRPISIPLRQRSRPSRRRRKPRRATLTARKLRRRPWPISSTPRCATR